MQMRERLGCLIAVFAPRSRVSKYMHGVLIQVILGKIEQSVRDASTLVFLHEDHTLAKRPRTTNGEL